MKTRQRPMSPYMLGPYYKFQLTSFLSIASRITGVFVTVVTAPLAVAWLIALAIGPEAYAQLGGWMDNIIGRLILVFSVLSLSYHLFSGIRHLLWDAGWFLDLRGIYATGYLMVACTVILSAVVIGVTL